MTAPAKLSYTARIVCIDTLLFGTDTYNPHGTDIQMPCNTIYEALPANITGIKQLDVTSSLSHPSVGAQICEALPANITGIKQLDLSNSLSHTRNGGQFHNTLTTGEYLIQLLETGCFTAVSEELLQRVVEYYPFKLDNRLLLALLPPYAREINLTNCKEKLTLMGLVEGLKKCPHLKILNLQNCSQLLHADVFTLSGLMNEPLTTLVLEGNRNITDDIVQAAIRSFPNLMSLNISCCTSVTDDVFLLDPILQLKRETSQKHIEAAYTYRLSCVDMSGISSISSVAVRHLSSLCGPNLRQLNLAWSTVDSTVLFYLAGFNFPAIVDLVLDRESELNKERDLKEYIAELKEIKELYLFKNQEERRHLNEHGNTSIKTEDSVIICPEKSTKPDTVCVPEPIASSFNNIIVNGCSDNVSNNDIDQVVNVVNPEDLQIEIEKDGSLYVIKNQVVKTDTEDVTSDSEDASLLCQNVKLYTPDDALDNKLDSDLKCDHIKTDAYVQNFTRTALGAAHRIAEFIKEDETESDTETESDSFADVSDIDTGSTVANTMETGTYVQNLTKTALQAAHKISESIKEGEKDTCSDIETKSDGYADLSYKDTDKTMAKTKRTIASTTSDMVKGLSDIDSSGKNTSELNENVGWNYSELNDKFAEISDSETDVDEAHVCIVCSKLSKQIAESRLMMDTNYEQEPKQKATAEHECAMKTELCDNTHSRNCDKINDYVANISLKNEIQNIHCIDYAHKEMLRGSGDLASSIQVPFIDTDKDELTEPAVSDTLGCNIEEELGEYIIASEGHMEAMVEHQNTSRDNLVIKDLNMDEVTPVMDAMVKHQNTTPDHLDMKDSNMDEVTPVVFTTSYKSYERDCVKNADIGVDEIKHGRNVSEDGTIKLKSVIHGDSSSNCSFKANPTTLDTLKIETNSEIGDNSKDAAKFKSAGDNLDIEAISKLETNTGTSSSVHTRTSETSTGNSSSVHTRTSETSTGNSSSVHTRTSETSTGNSSSVHTRTSETSTGTSTSVHTRTSGASDQNVPQNTLFTTRTISNDCLPVNPCSNTTKPKHRSTSSMSKVNDTVCKDTFSHHMVFKPGLFCLDITNIKFINRKLGQLCLQTFLRENPILQKLELSWKGLTEEFLKEVLPNVPDLTEVSMEECTCIQSGGLAALLKQCQNLRNINLRGVVFIKDMAMAPLYTMENLTKLNLAESEISDATLFRISNRCSEKLTEIDLSWCEGISERGINYVCLKCTQLQRLVLRSCPVSNITLYVLSKNCPQLTELIIDSVEGVSSHEFSDDGLLEVADKLLQLQILDISWNLSITNVSVISLMANLIHLKEVHMKGLKQITCTPFLPIISGVRDENGNVNEFWIDEYCNHIQTAHSLKRSTVFAPNLSVLGLEYSDLVEDKRLELIVKVCRGSLEVTDYYGRQLVPDESSSLVISSASVHI